LAGKPSHSDGGDDDDDDDGGDDENDNNDDNDDDDDNNNDDDNGDLFVAPVLAAGLTGVVGGVGGRLLLVGSMHKTW
jgi:hypothetical protein